MGAQGPGAQQLATVDLEAPDSPAPIELRRKSNRSMVLVLVPISGLEPPMDKTA